MSSYSFPFTEIQSLQRAVQAKSRSGELESFDLFQFVTNPGYRSVIPTFSLTLTVCCELLAPCQSLVQRYLRTTTTTERLSGLTQMNIHSTTSPLITMPWFSFLLNDILEVCFMLIPSLTEHKIEIRLNAVYFHRSFINENLHVFR